VGDAMRSELGETQAENETASQRSRTTIRNDTKTKR